MKMEKRIDRRTEREDWAQYYSSRAAGNAMWQEVDDTDFRNMPHTSIMRLLAPHMQGDVIEIDAGDSHHLIDVQKRFELKRVVGLDYLPEACELLRERAEHAKANIEVICADLYEPPPNLVNSFDVVMSYGVVEHFTDLNGVVEAISRFAKQDGVIITLIPNLKGSIYQTLMKRWNRKVYDAHVPYDVSSVAKAHETAGLKVEACRYLLSSNFGMLSWCFVDRPERGLAYHTYVWLTRFSKALWWLERKFVPLPASKTFSPYIVCIARKV